MTKEEFIKDFERKHNDPHIIPLSHHMDPHEVKKFVKTNLDDSELFFTEAQIMDDKKDGQLLIRMKYLP